MTTTETTSTSWFSRLGSSVKNIFFGILLVIGAIALLFWNEGRAVKTEQSLREGLSVVVSVPAEARNEANDGKLIHFSGAAKTSDRFVDADFGVGGNLLKMKRTVEIYQWKENTNSHTREKLGGGTETTTTYTYTKEWSSSINNSSSFRESETHINPTAKPFADKEWVAGDVMVGAYSIPPLLLNALSGYQSFSPTEEMLSGKSSTMPAELKLVGNAIYYMTSDPANPVIGSTRIRYDSIAPQDLSVIAKQTGQTLTAYRTKNGESLLMIQLGTATADEMFKGAQESNNMTTWILRLVGVVLMFIGFQMILGVLPVIGSVVPFIGHLIGAGVGLVAFVLTLAVSCVTIAIAWIAYRPLVGLLLIAVAVASFVFLRSQQPKTTPKQ